MVAIAKIVVGRTFVIARVTLPVTVRVDNLGWREGGGGALGGYVTLVIGV
jgi:hypothetical protein